MARKLIITTSWILLATIYLKMVLISINHWYDPNPGVLITICTVACAAISIIVAAILITYIVIEYINFLEGEYDIWLKQNIDPALKKFCDWVNRRNGGCNE